MKVTKFQYPLEECLLKKIDLMILRCTRRNPKSDAVAVIEAPEGVGKTSLSVALAYYIAEKTGRKFDTSRIFFDARKMIEFLQSTEDEIAIWDEPALHALTKDTITKVVKDVERLLMMSRKKRHFLIINIAYFNRFNDYIVWQRPLGMIHLYTRDGSNQVRFIYIRKKHLENLWMDWKKYKRRNYWKYRSRRVSGTCPDVLNPDYKHNVLSEFNYFEYEKMKDAAIMSVGTEKKHDTQRMLKQQKKDVLVRLKFFANKKGINLKQKDVAEILGVNPETIRLFSKEIEENYPQREENIIINGNSVNKITKDDVDEQEDKDEGDEGNLWRKSHACSHIL